MEEWRRRGSRRRRGRRCCRGTGARLFPAVRAVENIRQICQNTHQIPQNTHQIPLNFSPNFVPLDPAGAELRRIEPWLAVGVGARRRRRRCWRAILHAFRAGSAACACATAPAVPAEASARVAVTRAARLWVRPALAYRPLGDGGTVGHARRWGRGRSWRRGRGRLVRAVGVLAPVHNPRGDAVRRVRRVRLDKGTGTGVDRTGPAEACIRAVF